ncbi:hypothetical protein MMC30_002673 [Trapelia coarctata]|nr:hypothetical protein [Trapelia coarctata]
MDFSLRCNSLKCRVQLTDRAVVTTCSHIFCIPCSEHLGLANPGGGPRSCPACSTGLTNPDDAVSTLLNPTEDYKTSVLSGMSPTAIMECAGRGLAFWAYQSTQEIIYQEYLAKSLTDKYGNLSVQMDKIIHDANAEIDNLSQNLANMQLEQEKLKTENAKLANAYRDKARKHQQTQELYDRLKRKEMTQATQSAAFDSVDEVLQSVSSRQDSNGLGHITQYHGDLSPSKQFTAAQDIGDPLHAHQRVNNDDHTGSARMMPPPMLRPGPVFGNQTFGQHTGVAATPSGHRTRLGSALPSVRQQASGSTRNFGAFAPASSHSQTPSQRRPLLNLGGNNVNRPSVSGYGMSAGMKIGRQQGQRFGGYGNTADRFTAPQQAYGDGGGIL